jgi:hypothetical protein
MRVEAALAKQPMSLGGAEARDKAAAEVGELEGHRVAGK